MLKADVMDMHDVVLVVGSGLNARVSAARYLKSRGLFVCEADDAASAVAMLSQLRATAVLLDGDHLEDGDAAGVARALVPYPQPSLVYLSARPASLVPGKLLPYLLRKPCDPALLLETLRRLGARPACSTESVP